MGKMTFATTLSEKRPLTPGVRSFRFERPDGYDFQAGQWFVITIPSSDGPLTKHFTHSSAPAEPFLEFTTRLTGSPFKNALDALPLGSEVQMEGPFGTFVLRDGLTRVAFLTGGIGVTPVRSILRSLADVRASSEAAAAGEAGAGSSALPLKRLLKNDVPAAGARWEAPCVVLGHAHSAAIRAPCVLVLRNPSAPPPREAAFQQPAKIVVFYGNLSEETITFGEELIQIAGTLPETRLVNVLSQPSTAWTGYQGYINADIVRTELTDPDSWTYYLSGPPPMVEAMRALLGEFDIPRKKMVIENFEGYAS